jgi:hypothetical protein
MSAHKAQVCATLSPMGQRLFRYIEFDDDEELTAEIRKHPIGLFFIWLTGGFVSAVMFIGASLLAYNLDNLGLVSIDGSDTMKSVILGLGIVLGVLGIIMTTITAILYSSNVIFITNEKIAEVAYLSLFHRRIKQLSVGNVEDVMVTQRGILPRLFNYGGLVVETAGEAENPAFTYVPRPNDYSQLIIQAHEKYVEQFGN